jgi:hypothetical protein
VTTYGRPPSHARCIAAIDEIRRRLADIEARRDQNDRARLDADLLRTQLDYWDGWRRILEDQPP